MSNVSILHTGWNIFMIQEAYGFRTIDCIEKLELEQVFMIQY